MNIGTSKYTVNGIKNMEPLSTYIFLRYFSKISKIQTNQPKLMSALLKRH